MVESISQIKFGIDPFSILDRIISIHSIDLPQITNISYDKEADVLYVKFTLSKKAVDNEVIDADGLILLGRDKSAQIVALTILEASTFLQ